MGEEQYCPEKGIVKGNTAQVGELWRNGTPKEVGRNEGSLEKERTGVRALSRKRGEMTRRSLQSGGRKGVKIGGESEVKDVFGGTGGICGDCVR
jgi:hypothetical protein